MTFIPHIDFIASLVLFGVLQAICLAVIFSLKRNLNESISIGALMLVLAIIELESFLTYSGYIIYVPWMINLSPPLILLIGPLAFLQVKNILHLNGSFKNKLRHFIPAIAYALYSLFFFLQPDSFKINAALENFHPGSAIEQVLPSFPIDPLHIQGIVVIEGLGIHLLFYTVMCAIVIIRIKVQTPRLRH